MATEILAQGLGFAPGFISAPPIFGPLEAVSVEHAYPVHDLLIRDWQVIFNCLKQPLHFNVKKAYIIIYTAFLMKT